MSLKGKKLVKCQFHNKNIGVFSNSIDLKEDDLSEVVVKERINKMPVPRTDGLARFRDTYLKVRLQSMTSFVLHYVKTLFRISRR